MLTTSTNALFNQSSSTYANLELTQPNDLERGSTNDEGDAASSDSANANESVNVFCDLFQGCSMLIYDSPIYSSSPAETEQRLRLDDIDTTEDSYESVMNRISQWRETTSTNSEIPTNDLEINQIPEMIEISREETNAEIELRQKLRLLQDLLNKSKDIKDCSDDSDEEENENVMFKFLIGQPDFKDVLFLRMLYKCSPFYLNGGVSKSFGKCAHLLRTSETTKEYFSNLSINSGKRLLKDRFLFLKSWTTGKPRRNLINSLSKAEDDEIHELIRDLLEQKTLHSTHKQSINGDQSSALSGSDYGSVSSYETSFASESLV
ncbi:uncharacterized protein MELLADRAFT_70235 [Melampsora larici-populina 98AG31]|uniref:Uncharacterized protein n=1 Tax=Melampsora larici-populina (strain 98AG31 / pathotype 3-4-7) TaxID=747676 RepID=F4SE52_MELLP|nr:uncharacterized protein MELLADRAFT_70235 [Melampsora larici-populina 98AG31]EGF97073.1 hypothetical protein MELLADRAFT_70235 [Melampsora larici-populina 98AG31]